MSVPFPVTNTAGQSELEARSRRANALEALGFACVILIVLWPCCYGFGVLGDSAWIRRAAQWPVLLAILWALFGSPLWHRDQPGSLGLGNPIRLFSALRAGSSFQRWSLFSAVVLLFGVLFLVSVAHWPETARMFKLGHAARTWPATPAGLAKVGLFSGLFSAFIATCVVRYDNFWPAFRVAMLISIGLVLYSGTAALLHRGMSAFSSIDYGRYPLDVLAYMLWGGLQQFLFTGYFATRLRKAFPPATAPANIVAPARRLHTVLIGGGLCAGTLGPAVWLTVRTLSGSGPAPLSLLVWCAAFAFIPGAIWTWFFCRDKRRLLVATLSGSFFGLIHIDSYGLVLVTFGLGTILAYVFMEDQFRNLAALAFIHGFLGSTFGKFFRSEAAGALRVDYRVGPWNVEEPTATVLIIPLLCVAAYAVLFAICARRMREVRKRFTETPYNAG